jgi:hypothetical protein
MQRWLRSGILLSVVVLAATARAQAPVSIGVAGGVSLPSGDFGDAANTGWHALGTIGVSTLMQPLGLRLDVAYNRFADKAPALAGQDREHFAVTSGTLNVTYRLPMTNSPFSPYLIAGLGAYHGSCSGSLGCEGSTHFGWNGGLGINVAALGLRPFLEARYHSSKDLDFIPLTVGLRF